MNLTGNILDFDMVCDVRVDIFLGSADDGIIGFGCIFLYLSVFGGCVAVHSVDKFRQLAEGLWQWQFPRFLHGKNWKIPAEPDGTGRSTGCKHSLAAA